MKRKAPQPPNQNSNSDTGSPQPGGPVFLAIGKLRRPHGIEGEMLMDVLTDFPERIRARGTVFVGDEHEPLKIEKVRPQDRALLVHFVGYNSDEAAGHLRNKIVYIKADSLPALPEGEYYHHQLLGLKVIDQDNQEIGFLSEILETGANDVYIVVAPDGGETLLPAIADVIMEVNLEQREMRVRKPEWL